jgi:N-acetylglucosaminyldiphosphoundecaprenol N-acetyl-beta-D-mannosaminyltransferase
MFYLGSTEKVLQKITDRIHLEYPSVRVVGVHSPSYSIRIGEKENQNIISKINSANPDCLWVAMTAPKQEKWIQENRHRINARIIGAVGAVFDYYARETVYPSRIVRRMGMEWAARLVQQPKRLWKTNLCVSAVVLLACDL